MQHLFNLLIKPPPPKAEKSKALHLSFATVRGVNENFTAIQSSLQLNSPYLLALCESRRHNSIMSTSLTVPGYVIHRLDAPPCHGLCVFAKDTLPFGREILLEDVRHEYMCSCLALLHSTIYVYFLYHSPSSQNSAIFDAISNSIALALSRHPTAEIIVFGDFNVHHKEWLIRSHSTDAPGVSAFNFALSYDILFYLNFCCR